MADGTAVANDEGSRESDPNSTSVPTPSNEVTPPVESTAAPKTIESVGKSSSPSGDESGEPNPPPSTDDSIKKTPPPSRDEPNANNSPPSEDDPVDANPPPSTDDSEKKTPPPSSDEPIENNPLPSEDAPVEMNPPSFTDESTKKISPSSIGESIEENTAPSMDANLEESPAAFTDEPVQETQPVTTDEPATKTLHPSLDELARNPSGSGSHKKSKVENSSLTARLYEEQMKTGKLNRLTSVVWDQDGKQRLVQPGSVPQWHTVDISLAGKRPMSREKCRTGAHSCFDSPTARRERALSAKLGQGQYPDFMRLNPKLNEFVAASIIEKLRLKGLAAPLHIYTGRHLPSSLLAELVLKPKKKKVTDRYYFGYMPPPNRPRISTAFRRYLQEFAERHKAAESDLCYSYALGKVRSLAEQGDNSSPLPQSLAEVVRAQEEPGFGMRQLRRPRSAAV